MESMQSTSTAALAGQADRFYPAVTPDDEVVNRPIQNNILQGQGAFFRLITGLKVPILGSSGGSYHGDDHVSVGEGRTYGVSQFLLSLSKSLTTISRTSNSEQQIKASLASKKVVAKRINISTASGVTDEQQLAAITNEVRVLSNKTLNQANNFVDLICVTWDSIPRQGRFWPRLFLEAAEYGNLQEFLSLNTDAHTWNAKLSLALDVLTGLHMLHLHMIVHGDLKLENVLVFAEQDDHPLGIKYRAKLCDFGFSVIMTDYDSPTFSAKLGTPPWNAPELAFGTEINLEDLPSSDTYSFGLLFVRIFMNGGNPFRGLTLAEINDLKQEKDEGDMRLFNTLKDTMLATVEYSKGQAAILQKSILTTTFSNPTHRFPLNLVGQELTLIGCLFGRDQNEQNRSNGSESESEDASASPKPLDVSKEEPLPSPRSLSSMVASCLRTVASAFLQPFRYILKAVKWGAVSVLRYVLTATGVIKDPWKELLKPKEIKIDYVPGLPFARSRELENRFRYTQRESTEDIPDFERVRQFSAHNLSVGTAKELVRNLLSLADGPAPDDKIRVGEVSYQLAIAYFEGIGTPKDIQTSLVWLTKAAILESRKAISAISNIYASLGRQMPEEAVLARSSHLAQAACSALMEAHTDLFGGFIKDTDNFTVVQQWANERPSEYKEYIESSDYHQSRTIVFAFWLLYRGTSPLPGQDRTFSFKSLLGYDASKLEMITSEKPAFLRSVKFHNCVNLPDETVYLTLLQIAAIRGDLPLVTTLVEELGAKVNDAGVTPGMTALWLSCMFGNIDVTVYLAIKGASVKCRDNISGRSILHFLNQARSAGDMGSLLDLALSNGLTLEDKDKEGNTPLLSTFIGWDFSLGNAAKALVLTLDLNLLVKSEGGWTPLSAAVAKLDLGLIQAIGKRLPASQLRESSNLNILPTTVEDELAHGYNVLGVRNEFYRRRVCGAATEQVLQGIVDTLINDGMQVAMRNSEFGKGTNPLIGACHLGYDDLAIAVLNTPACPDVNEVDETNGMSALHWAAERGRYVTFIALLNRGASATLPRTDDECNPFHHGAVFAPTMLLKVIDSINSGEVLLAPNLDLELMMTIPNGGGFRIFDLAVIEGSADHLSLAETLRNRYRTPFDDYIVPSMLDGDENFRMTLLGYLVSSSVRSNVMEIESLEYLLNLSPQPKFRASTTGTTLLHFAVGGFSHVDMSSNPVGYFVLRLLLQTFSEKEYLYVADGQGLTPLHRAAYFANAVAIDIIQSHVESLNDKLDWNRLSSTGTTPLDYVGEVRGIVRISEEEHRALHTILKKNTIKCLVKLRELGGQFSRELNDTITIAIMVRRQDELSKERLLSWFHSIRRNCDLDWRFIEEPGVPFDMANTEASSFVVEICWAFDHFILQGSTMMTDQVLEHGKARLRHRLLSTNMNTTFPWHSIERVQEVQDNMQSLLGPEIRWNRQGDAWTKDDVQKLIGMVISEWGAIFEEPFSLAEVRYPVVEEVDSEPGSADNSD